MKFTIDSNDFLKRIQIVYAAVSSRPVLMIIENIHFSIKKNLLTMRATDLDIEMTTEIEVVSDGDFELCINAKIILDTIKELKNDEITVELQGTDKVTITSSKGTYVTEGDDAFDFPNEKTGKLIEVFDTSCEQFSDILNRTIFTASNDELRPAMTGVFFKTLKNKIEICCTDAYKLSKIEIASNTSAKATMIVKAKALAKLFKIIKSKKTDIEVFTQEAQAVFKVDNCVMKVRLIDAKYPDYRSVVPVSNENIIKIDKRALKSCLRRLDVFANRATREVIFNIGRKLMIETKDLDYSRSAEEHIAFEHLGNKLVTRMGFNLKFLLDILDKIDSEKVVFELNKPNTAALIKDENKRKTDFFLVMPVLIDSLAHAY